jgi:hypothetical protein
MYIKIPVFKIYTNSYQYVFVKIFIILAYIMYYEYNKLLSDGVCLLLVPSLVGCILSRRDLLASIYFKYRNFYVHILNTSTNRIKHDL